jgi:hypothetical protein
MPSEALPGDYEGSAASQVIGYLQSGAFAADEDKDKAAKAICEIVMGEGFSAGNEERFFLSGREIIPHAKTVQGQLGHMLD